MSVDTFVKAIFADTLRVPLHQIRPETMLRIGEISMEQIAFIADRIAWRFQLYPLPEPWRFDGWTTVGDAIDATERLIARKRERAA